MISGCWELSSGGESSLKTLRKESMKMKKNVCRWYDETSGMKRAYDQGLIDKKWVEDYCWNGGSGCVRKKRFEEEGYVSPDYVLPDGKVDEKLKKLIEERGRF
jgi:hypothetical protein